MTLLIDGNNLAYKSYYGAKAFMDEPLEMSIYLFLAKIRDILEFNDNYRNTIYKIKKVVVFWDGENSGGLRQQMYSPYKENRSSERPTELIKKIKEYLSFLYILQYQDEIVECDDLIAYYVLKRKHKEKILIASGDRDLWQLIDKNVSVYDLSKNYLSPNKFYDKKTFIKEFGFLPKNLRLIKTIEGDSSDNIKGIKGVGRRTLLGFLPSLLDREYNIREMLTELKKVSKINKSKKLISILEGNSDYLKGNEFFKKTYEIIDLYSPKLTDEAKKQVIKFFKPKYFLMDSSILLQKLKNDKIDTIIKTKHNKLKTFFKPFKYIKYAKQKK